MDYNYFYELYERGLLMAFIVYTSLNHNAVLKNIKAMRDDEQSAGYEETLAQLLEESYEADLDRHLLKMYLCYLIAMDENVFSLTAEKEGENIDSVLCELALKDIKLIMDIFNRPLIDITLESKNKQPLLNDLYDFLEEGPTPKEVVNYLVSYYKHFGAGKMNRYKAFKWDQKEGLIGIDHCDPILLSELIGCDYQKASLVKNTENFLNGKEANNVLLFGDSGTGKSSCVKALLNTYYKDGLRLIDLSKADFMFFNKILKCVKNRGLKYIIFLDDLSFEEFETEYKYMKALIEGGVEVKPNNVLIYATSNRRHLIRETWDERQGQDVHITDTRQEKLSLSDRFGLALTFTSPNQNAYLEIVFSLAKAYNLQIEERLLREKAIQWELIHGGRSGRVAKQFIQSLL